MWPDPLCSECGGCSRPGGPGGQHVGGKQVRRARSPDCELSPAGRLARGGPDGVAGRPAHSGW